MVSFASFLRSLSRGKLLFALVVVSALVAYALLLPFWKQNNLYGDASFGGMRNSLAQKMIGGEYEESMTVSASAPAMGGPAMADEYAMDMAYSERKMIIDPIMPPVPEPGYQTGGGADLAPAERMIIKNGNVSAVVDDVPRALEQVAAYAKDKKGYEVSRNVYKYDVGFAGSIVIRVPVATFEESMSSIRSLGEVTSQSVSGQDITEEFIDVEAQIRNLKLTEEQFVAIMRKAEKIEDVLSVQRELTNVRSQIERLEGRKRYLSENSALSTITVSVSTNPENLPVVTEDESWKPLAVVKDAVRQLLEFGKVLFAKAVWFLVFVPVWVVVGLVFWIIFRLLRRRFNV